MRAGLLTAAALLGLCGTAQAAGNPLFGTWTLVKPGCDSISKRSYSESETANFYAWDENSPATWHHVPIGYNVSSTEIWLIPRDMAAGTHPWRVFVLDASHIKPDEPRGCIYRRAN